MQVKLISLEYFYLIRHKASGKFYAGSKYAKKQFIHPDQFWNENWNGPGKPYYTSSDTIKRLIIEEGYDSFEICYIGARSNAREFEAEFLNTLNVAKDSQWINSSNGNSKFRCPDQLSNKTKLKMSLSKMGKTRNSPSDETKLKMSLSQLGIKRKPHTTEHRVKLSEKQLTQPKLQCPHCDKIGGLIGMKRYHFDNCKLWRK